MCRWWGVGSTALASERFFFFCRELLSWERRVYVAWMNNERLRKLPRIQVGCLASQSFAQYLASSLGVCRRRCAFHLISIFGVQEGIASILHYTLFTVSRSCFNCFVFQFDFWAADGKIESVSVGIEWINIRMRMTANSKNWSYKEQWSRGRYEIVLLSLQLNWLNVATESIST